VSLTVPAAFVSSYLGSAPKVDKISLIYNLYVTFSNFVDRFHSSLEIQMMALFMDRSMVTLTKGYPTNNSSIGLINFGP